MLWSLPKGAPITAARMLSRSTSGARGAVLTSGSWWFRKADLSEHLPLLSRGQIEGVPVCLDRLHAGIVLPVGMSLVAASTAR